MKKGLFIFFLVLTGKLGHTQTFDEWFRQKATQKRYLIEQIAALKVYTGYVQKGFAIAKEGLTAVSDIKKGDFILHRDYFGSLKTVNSKISRYAKVADIIATQLKIVGIYKEVSKQVRTTDLYRATEADHIFRVFENLLNDCSAIIVLLTAVISPGELALKDDERLKRIDALHADMQEAFMFAQGFKAETKLLPLQRLKDQNDVQASRLLNDIKSK